MSDVNLMAEASHTPGPWWASGTEVGTVPMMAVKIAKVSGSNYAEATANACLIAAAPDLLAALKAAQKDLETVEREMSGIAPEAVSPALPLIRAAIAKAEGKS